MGAILFQELTPEINVTVAENSERHSMTPTYIHKLNLRVNMSYNMRHALNTIFCLLSVSYLVGELICCLHTRQLGRWYYYSKTNVCLHGDIFKLLKVYAQRYTNSTSVFDSYHYLRF